MTIVEATDGGGRAGATRLRRRHRTSGLHPLGLGLAVFFLAWSMTPSLVPRSWLFQGLVSGITAVIGYGLGVLIAVLTRRTRVARWLRGCPAQWRRAGWWALGIAALATILIMTSAAARWQRQLGALMGADVPDTPAYLRTAAVMVAVFGLLLVVARLLRALSRALSRLLHRWVWLPGLLAGVVAAGVVTVVVLVVLRDVVAAPLYRAADSSFAAANELTPEDLVAPSDPLRSGSSASVSDWETLGSEGQKFVTGGPAAGTLATDPIRAYVGLNADDGAQARAARAVAELERTGAFSRGVLAVITTTGSGWVNDTSASALELMYDGDTAMVSTQYSYLPSWVSFIVDRSRAQDAARALFDAVHARWARLPEQSRPTLLVFGESLGSQGSESAFSGLADIRDRTDGVLWAGPPNSNPLWSRFEARRDPGSPQVRPVYADGLVVRFENRPGDTARPQTPWLEPRVLYLQHPSDPIVWWSPELIWSRPGWLAGTRGFDVLPAMRWLPVVTFWQVTADMVNAQGVPDGHGHNYDDQIVDGWVSVAAPDGWSEADTAVLHRAVDALEHR